MRSINKETKALLLISIFFIVLISFIIFSSLDIFDPILTTEEDITLTPQMNKLLVELEQKYR